MIRMTNKNCTLPAFPVYTRRVCRCHKVGIAFQRCQNKSSPIQVLDVWHSENVRARVRVHNRSLLIFLFKPRLKVRQVVPHCAQNNDSGLKKNCTDLLLSTACSSVYFKSNTFVSEKINMEDYHVICRQTNRILFSYTGILPSREILP